MRHPSPSFLPDDNGSSAEGCGLGTLAELNAAVEAVVELEKRIAALHGARAAALVHAERLTRHVDLSAPDARKNRRHDPAVTERAFIAELATALHKPERTAERLIAESRQLVEKLPATLAQLASGDIGYRQAQSLVEESWMLPDDIVEKLEATMLPKAAESTPAGFARAVRRRREKLHPESITKRVQRSRGDRGLAITPCTDGMAELCAYLPAEDAVAIFDRVSSIARSLQGPDEERTLAQLRADVFRDIALAGGDGAPIIDASVAITIPALAWLGMSDETAALAGYGPIDMDTARRLAAGAKSWLRILTHPETGAVLSFGVKKYRPPSDLRQYIRRRDETCRFPGCSTAAVHSDIDHTVARADAGETEPENLACLCAKHHAVKHDSTWNVTQDPDGSGRLTWISPTGRVHVTVPEFGAEPVDAVELGKRLEQREAEQAAAEAPQEKPPF